MDRGRFATLKRFSICKFEGVYFLIDELIFGEVYSPLWNSFRPYRSGIERASWAAAGVELLSEPDEL